MYPSKNPFQERKSEVIIRFVRLFIGVFIPEELRSALFERGHDSFLVHELSWAKKDNLHITMKFLGDVEKGRQPAISETIREVAARFRPFNLSIGSPGVFPTDANPSVFWMGVQGDVEALKKTAVEIENKLETLGYPREKREYSPHVTLARAGQGQSKIPGRALSEQFCKLFSDMKSPMFNVHHIQLIQSQLSPEGSRYSVLDSFPLTAQ